MDETGVYRIPCGTDTTKRTEFTDKCTEQQVLMPRLKQVYGLNFIARLS